MAQLDHNLPVDAALRRLPAFDKPVLRAQLQPVLDDLNRIEAVLARLFAWADPETSVGGLLRAVASVFNVPNPDDEMPDPVYRRFVKAAALASLSQASFDDVELVVDGRTTTRPGVKTIAETMQVRAVGDPVVVSTAVPFTWVIVIPGLLGVERQLAKEILVRAIGATDRLYLFGPPEGSKIFTWNEAAELGWNSGVWGEEI